MVQRLHYVKKNTFNTKSNLVRPIKTPGGRLVYQYINKRVSPKKCGQCGVKLQGIKQLRDYKLKKATKTAKSVARPYGGTKCARCTRNNILMSFLNEEQNKVEKVLNEKKKN